MSFFASDTLPRYTHVGSVLKPLLSKIIAGPTANRACKAKMKTLEYREGPEAKENFDKAMQALFQTSKPTTRKTKKASPQSLRKKPRSDKN